MGMLLRRHYKKEEQAPQKAPATPKEKPVKEPKTSKEKE